MRSVRRVGHVTVVLSRPDSQPDGTIIHQIGSIDGDSHLAICAPAIDVQTPGRSLKFEWHSSDRNAVVIGSANTAGRLGKLVVSDLRFVQAYECERAALSIVNPLVTHLAHVNGIPLLIWQMHIAPAQDQRSMKSSTNLPRSKSTREAAADLVFWDA